MNKIVIFLAVFYTASSMALEEILLRNKRGWGGQHGGWGCCKCGWPGIHGGLPGGSGGGGVGNARWESTIGEEGTGRGVMSAGNAGGGSGRISSTGNTDVSSAIIDLSGGRGTSGGNTPTGGSANDNGDLSTGGGGGGRAGYVGSDKVWSGIGANGAWAGGRG